LSNVKDLVGLEYAPYSFEVEKGKIKEFAAAIGDENPLYYDVEAAQKEGFQGIPIPLTFLQVIDLWGGYSFQEKTEKLKLNPVKILHGEQEYELVKEIYAGDVLTVTAKVTNVDIKKGSSGGMDLITTENRYVNQRNKLVAISKGVTVHRH
jgi:acyl dehydratase